MTIAQAKKLLPAWGRGLSIGITSVSDLRMNVYTELRTYQHGLNPLSPKQVKVMEKFMELTK